MKKNAEFEALKLKISRRIFFVFVALSLAALAYINMTSGEDIKLIANQFPELSVAGRKALITSYKILLSAGLIFFDIILVGPFAYLSYFSEHIKPRAGHVINYLSFFDLGILLGCIFTVLWGGAHFVVANSVSAQPRNLLGVGTLFYIILGAFALWCVLCLLKTYTYTAYQRKELKKYMIMF